VNGEDVMGFWRFAALAIVGIVLFWIAVSVLCVVHAGAISKPVSVRGQVWKLMCGVAELLSLLYVLWKLIESFPRTILGW
jgi:hypothetical protein